MLQEDFATQCHLGVKNSLLFLYGLGNFIFLTLALYTAFVPVSLPNSSLLCYGFAAICAWQMSIQLDIYIPFLQSQKKHKTVGFLFILWGLIFVYTGCVSAIATFFLFPHPNILERFSFPIPLQLPTLVYLPSIWVIFLILQKGYYLAGDVSHPFFENLWKSQQWREKLFQEWTQKKMETSSKGEIFSASLLNFLKKKFFSIWTFLLIIPIWTLIIIPHKSYTVVPFLYHIFAFFTVILVLCWLSKMIIFCTLSYTISAEGIVQKSLLAKKTVLWVDCVSIFLLEENLILKTKSESILFCHSVIKSSNFFFAKLMDCVPLGLLLISEEGWQCLQKTWTKIEFDNFVFIYQKIWTWEEIEKKGEVQKKKKKTSK